VCDLIGLNRVSRKILRNGALALAGMLRNGAAITVCQTARDEMLLIADRLADICRHVWRKTYRSSSRPGISTRRN
jgi:hypothetical protein